MRGSEHVPVDGSHVPASWHWSLAVQTTGFEPAQVPDWQASAWVQALPSLHGVPSALGVTVHVEVPLHVLALHWSSVHVIGVPAHVPDVHTSSKVHELPSSQIVPSGPEHGTLHLPALPALTMD